MITMKDQTDRGPRRTSDRPAAQRLRVCVAGAAPDTANLGVSALGYATVTAILRWCPAGEVVLFDHGRGMRDEELSDGPDRLHFRRMGAVHSRRLYRAENLHRMRLRAWATPRWRRAFGSVEGVDAVLDASAGDSFTDLYGPRRFQTVMLTKRIALTADIPLVLLPQTYGPFANSSLRRQAQRVVRRAAMAWARDGASFQVLCDLAGNVFDPARHRQGVDLAFALEPATPPHGDLEPLNAWLERQPGAPLVGLNVSGLLYNRPDEARAQYHLRADYRAAAHGLIERLIEGSDAGVMLVPHVVTRPGHMESDVAACQHVRQHLSPSLRHRVLVAPALDDPRQVKWLIGRCDWFCGTRMHAGIAALSSGVPAAAMAYSVKTKGVFASCGQGSHVADLRDSDAPRVVDHLWQSWLDRGAARAALGSHLPAVRRLAVEQVHESIAAVTPGDRRAVPA